MNSEGFLRKAVITVMLKLCFHRCLIHMKRRRKTLLEASAVLIQALIRLLEQFFKVFYESCDLELTFSNNDFSNKDCYVVIVKA